MCRSRYGSSNNGERSSERTLPLSFPVPLFSLAFLSLCVCVCLLGSMCGRPRLTFTPGHADPLSLAFVVISLCIPRGCCVFRSCRV